MIDRKVVVLVGVGVVGVAAAVPSLAGLTGLAMRTGWSSALAPLLPVSVDAAGIVASLVWLDPDQSATIRRYARAVVMTALALSVAGNAGDHALAALGLAAPLLLVLAVAAVSPIALAATAHLAALLTVDRPDSIDRQLVDEPVESTSTAVVTETSVDHMPASPTVTDPTDRDLTDSGRSAQVRTPVEAGRVDRSTSTSRTVDELVDELDRLVADPTVEVNPSSAESIRRALRVGSAKARAVREAHAAASRPRIVHSA